MGAQSRQQFSWWREIGQGTSDPISAIRGRIFESRKPPFALLPTTAATRPISVIETAFGASQNRTPLRTCTASRS